MPDPTNDTANDALFTGEPLDTAQTELLPPIKRAGKRRKTTDPNDPAAEVMNADKPSRRVATNSYWSVEEKRRLRELVSVHGNNARAVAAELVGKSERQVANFLDAHRDEMQVDEGSADVNGDGLGQPRLVDEEAVGRPQWM